MPLHILAAAAISVFLLSGVLAMAGLGAAFIFVPLFHYMGVPLAEATATALLLNVVSLSFATAAYWRGGLVDKRVGLPILVAAVVLSPLGARATPRVDTRVLLAMFAAFLVYAGAMMLRSRSVVRARRRDRPMEIAAGVGVGGVAGFLGGLLGVGGGNFILPLLNWIGLEPKVAVGTTAFVVVFASLSGFLGHITLGGLEPRFFGVMAVMAAAGSIVGARLTTTKVSGSRLKTIIGVLLWVIAAKIGLDLMG